MASLLFSSPTLSLSPQGHVWYSCSAVWSKHAQEHEVSTCLKGEKPLFQRGVMSKPRLRWPPSAQNRAENLPIRRAPRSAVPFLGYDGCGLFLLEPFGCGSSSDSTGTWQWLSTPVSHCGDTDQQYLSIEMFLEYDWCVFYPDQWLIRVVGVMFWW